MHNRMNRVVDSKEKKSEAKVLVEKSEAKKEKQKDKKNEKVRRLVDDEYFSSHVQPRTMILFVDERYPTRKIHPFMPFISYTRNMLIGIFLFPFVRYPYAQVSIIGLIEIVYMMIVILYRSKAEKVDNIIDVFNTLTNSSFVSLKLLTVCNIDDNTRQQVVGRLMVIILVINFIGNILYVVYSIIATIVDVLGCTGGDDKYEGIEALNIKWKQSIIIYEYPVQPLVFDGEREATPIVVDEQEEVMNEEWLDLCKLRRVSQLVSKNIKDMNDGVNGGQGSIKKLKFGKVHMKEVKDKDREDLIEDIIEEKVVSSRKVMVGPKNDGMKGREGISQEKKVPEDKTEPLSYKMGEKLDDGDMREDIGLFSEIKGEKMEIRDDIMVEDISEEEGGFYHWIEQRNKNERRRNRMLERIKKRRWRREDRRMASWWRKKVELFQKGVYKEKNQRIIIGRGPQVARESKKMEKRQLQIAEEKEEEEEDKGLN